MTTNSVASIILAAGKGTRMRSKRAKVLHELGGEPMIARAVRAVAAVKPNPDPIVIVVGHQAREVEAAVKFPNARFALQEPQRGTGDAARAVRGMASDGDDRSERGDEEDFGASVMELESRRRHDFFLNRASSLSCAPVFGFACRLAAASPGIKYSQKLNRSLSTTRSAIGSRQLLL